MVSNCCLYLELMAWLINFKGAFSKASTTCIDQGRQNLSHSPCYSETIFFFHKEGGSWLHIHGEIASRRCFQPVAMQKTELAWARHCACQALWQAQIDTPTDDKTTCPASGKCICTLINSLKLPCLVITPLQWSRSNPSILQKEKA